MSDGQQAVGGVAIEPFNDALFAKLRAEFGVNEDGSTGLDFLALDQFSFESLAHGGGKGGSLMAFTKNEKFIVKEMSDGDHQSLLRIAADYINHVLDDEGSMLARIFVHFQIAETGKKFMCMNNWLPPIRDLAARQLLTAARRSSYDLKGTADDKTLVVHGQKLNPVHKRVWKVHMWCGQCFWSDQRRRYHQGKIKAVQVKFHLSEKKRQWVQQRIARDTEWLISKGLMDYSLVVSVQQLPLAERASAVNIAGSYDRHTQPLGCVHGASIQLVYLGVIDFLQQWTCAKFLAMTIKSFERNKSTVPPHVYGRQFAEYFKNKFLGDAEDLLGDDVDQPEGVQSAPLSPAPASESALSVQQGANRSTDEEVASI